MPKLKKKSIEQRSRADKERKQQIRGKSLHVVTLLYVYYLVWYTDLGGRGVFRRLTSLLCTLLWLGMVSMTQSVQSLLFCRLVTDISSNRQAQCWLATTNWLSLVTHLHRISRWDQLSIYKTHLACPFVFSLPQLCSLFCSFLCCYFRPKLLPIAWMLQTSHCHTAMSMYDNDLQRYGGLQSNV